MLGIPRTTIKFFQIGYNRWIQKRRWSSEKTSLISWCRERKNWTVDDHWKNWKFSDECQVENGNKNRV